MVNYVDVFSQLSLIQEKTACNPEHRQCNQYVTPEEKDFQFDYRAFTWKNTKQDKA